MIMKDGRFLRPTRTQSTKKKREEKVWGRLTKQTMSVGKFLRQKVVNTFQGKTSAKPEKLHTGQNWPW